MSSWHFLCLLTGSADSTEENRVVLLELIESTIWDVFAGLFIGLRAPIIVLELQLERLEYVGQGIQCCDSSIDDLWANSIGWNRCDAVCFKGHVSVVIKLLFEVGDGRR